MKTYFTMLSIFLAVSSTAYTEPNNAVEYWVNEITESMDKSRYFKLNILGEFPQKSDVTDKCTENELIKVLEHYRSQEEQCPDLSFLTEKCSTSLTALRHHLNALESAISSAEWDS